MSPKSIFSRYGIVKVSSVPPSGAEYLIPGMVQLGAINILQGEPGCGKTSIAMAICAAVSCGTNLPGMPVMINGPVLMLSDEDSAGQLRIALAANGADLDLCYIVTRPGDLAIGTEDFSAIMDELRPALVIIDPIQAYLGTANINMADQLRPVLAKLSASARQNNCAVIIIAHTAKNRNDKTRIYQTLGSIDLPAAARCIASCAPQPNGDGFVLTPIKCSAGPLGPSIEYRINADRRVEWGTVLGDIPDPLVRDPLYHALVHLANNPGRKLYTFEELDSTAMSITGRSVVSWDLISRKLAGCVGDALFTQRIAVFLKIVDDTQYIEITTPYGAVE